MLTRRADNFLWLLTALLVAASVGVAAYTLVPEDAATEGIRRPAMAATKPTTLPAEPDGDAGLMAAFARDLRRPLYDPPPPPPAVPVAATVLAVKLVGTAIDGAQAAALLAWPDGRTRFAAVGETANGVEVLAVEPGSATVRFGGRRVTLDVPKKEGR